MLPARSSTALLHGIRLCVTEPEIRRLSLRPWIVGALIYVLAFFLGLWAHETLYTQLAPAAGHWWSTALSWVVWFGVSILVLAASMIIAVVALLISTSVFQTAIAASVMKLNGVNLPEEFVGLSGSAYEVKRTLLTECGKLFWLGPLLIFALIISIIPLLLPLGILLSAWLLAYQFVDVVLDLFRIRPLKRFKFARSHSPSLLLFGGVLMLLWTIPFMGILLAPAAVAAAAWMLSDESYQDEINQIRPDQLS